MELKQSLTYGDINWWQGGGGSDSDDWDNNDGSTFMQWVRGKKVATDVIIIDTFARSNTGDILTPTGAFARSNTGDIVTLTGAAVKYGDTFKTSKTNTNILIPAAV